MKPQETLRVLSAIVSSRPCSFTREGIALSERDTATVDIIYTQILCILVDHGYLATPVNKPLVGRIVAELKSPEIIPVLSGFGTLYSLCQTMSPKGFKALCCSISPTLFSVLKDDYRAMVAGDVLAAKRLIQVFAWPSRLTLLDIDLQRQCLDDYLEIESRLQDCNLSSTVKALKSYIHKWMEDFDPERFQFQHGNGSTAFTGKVRQKKYGAMTSDQLLRYVFKDAVETPHFSKDIGLNRMSETTFVPKSWKTFRTISMEPPTLMYYQQGVWKEIDRVIQASRYLKKRIDCHTPERNVELARLGSSSRCYATIDLSAASDSVTWDLVKQLFKGTKIYPYLVATRSKVTKLPNGKKVVLKKFAPMGSALCFPIETIVFASVCELITRRHSHTTGERFFAGNYSVYGDDIIVPTEVATDVVSLLNQLGFSVNEDKSFIDPNIAYRESCGGEFIGGIDVTPIRCSRDFTSDFSTQLVKIGGLIDSANSCFSAGFYCLRASFIRELKRYKFDYVCGQNGLLSYHSTNHHLSSRYNARLQRLEYKVTRILLDEEDEAKTRGDEEIAYYHWLAVTRYRDRELDYDHFESRVGNLKPLKRRTSSSWVSTNDGCHVTQPFSFTDEVYGTLCTRAFVKMSLSIYSLFLRVGLRG